MSTHFGLWTKVSINGRFRGEASLVRTNFAGRSWVSGRAASIRRSSRLFWGNRGTPRPRLCKRFNGADSGIHSRCRRCVCRMNHDAGRSKSSKRDGLFDPENHVVAGPARVVAEIMIETQLLDRACLQKRNDLRRPVSSHPSDRRRPQIIEINLHFRFPAPIEVMHIIQARAPKVP